MATNDQRDLFTDFEPTPASLFELAHECERCPKLVRSRSQIVYPTPLPPGGILAIGEAPGADEDESGHGFVGAAGRRLHSILGERGLRRGEHYGVANIVRCWPKDAAGKTRKPSRSEVLNCLPFLAQSILKLQPKVLLFIGDVPTSAFMGEGKLFDKIQWNADAEFRADAMTDSAHSSLREVTLMPGLLAVASPHTSGLAWNRKASNGQRWSDIGSARINLAVELAGFK